MTSTVVQNVTYMIVILVHDYEHGAHDDCCHGDYQHALSDLYALYLYELVDVLYGLVGGQSGCGLGGGIQE